MSCLAALEKTPSDRLDYDVDFARWLTDYDIIVSATATIADTDVTFTLDGVFWSNEIVKVWVIGGADGEQSEIAVYATTQSGRIKEACFSMRVKDCS